MSKNVKRNYNAFNIFTFDVSKQKTVKSQYDLLLIAESVFNEKNPQKLKRHVTSRMAYESQWIKGPIVGSRKFHDFIERKFDAIRKSKSVLQASIKETKGGLKYVEFRQGDLSEIACCLLITSEKGRIVRIDVVKPGFIN